MGYVVWSVVRKLFVQDEEGKEKFSNSIVVWLLGRAVRTHWWDPGTSASNTNIKFSHICITIMVNINTDSQLPCWWWTQMTADFEELTNANFFYLIQSFLAARSETRANYRQSKGDTQALFLQVFTSIYCCQLVHNITHNFGQLEVLNMTNAINNGHLLVNYTDSLGQLSICRPL